MCCWLCTVYWRRELSAVPVSYRDDNKKFSLKMTQQGRNMYECVTIDDKTVLVHLLVISVLYNIVHGHGTHYRNITFICLKFWNLKPLFKLQYRNSLLKANTFRPVITHKMMFIFKSTELLSNHQNLNSSILTLKGSSQKDGFLKTTLFWDVIPYNLVNTYT
jgi:hypothetical protein